MDSAPTLPSPPTNLVDITHVTLAVQAHGQTPKKRRWFSNTRSLLFSCYLLFLPVVAYVVWQFYPYVSNEFNTQRLIQVECNVSNKVHLLRRCRRLCSCKLTQVNPLHDGKQSIHISSLDTSVTCSNSRALFEKHISSATHHSFCAPKLHKHSPSLCICSTLFSMPSSESAKHCCQAPRLVRLPLSISTLEVDNVLSRTNLVSGDNGVPVVRHNPINRCIHCGWRRYRRQLPIYSTIRRMASVLLRYVSSQRLFYLSTSPHSRHVCLLL